MRHICHKNIAVLITTLADFLIKIAHQRLPLNLITQSNTHYDLGIIGFYARLTQVRCACLYSVEIQRKSRFLKGFVRFLYKNISLIFCETGDLHAKEFQRNIVLSLKNCYCCDMQSQISKTGGIFVNVFRSNKSVSYIKTIIKLNTYLSIPKRVF